MKKKYDVVVFGATSFVGQILCRYLLQEFGTRTHPGKRALTWAIAGRSRTKLDELISALNVELTSLDSIVADAADQDALIKLCDTANVVVSTVGPYALYGEPLIRACVVTGTDYCDLTGEAQWMRRMISKYEADAKKNGARIVHCCGFDSIPSDLGVWFLQRESMTHYGEPCTSVKMRVKAMRGAASGGTIASMVNVVREASKDAALRRELANPYSLVMPAPAKPVRQTNIQSATYDKDFSTWIGPFVMAAVNIRVVHRSNALSNAAYSPAFRYDEAMMMGCGVRGRLRATTFSAGLAGFVVGAALSPTRWLMEKFMLPAPGEGPSPAAQEKGFYDFRFLGKTADGRELRVKVTGDRDPGYGSTAKMLGEAAACMAQDIAKDALPGGFWTPSTAMGEALLTRLTRHAGLTFELLKE
jgi:short subunit dehydrogenase-like uncharacterized protein